MRSPLVDANLSATEKMKVLVTRQRGEKKVVGYRNLFSKSERGESKGLLDHSLFKHFWRKQGPGTKPAKTKASKGAGSRLVACSLSKVQLSTKVTFKA